VSEFRTGNGADWLDLLVTRLGRYRGQPVEMLAEPAALRAWFAEHGMEPAAEVTVADLTATHTLREALHRAAVATLEGRPVDAGDLTREEVPELAQVLAGDADGRRAPEEITTFDSTGLAIQDLAISLAAMEALDEVDPPLVEI